MTPARPSSGLNRGYILRLRFPSLPSASERLESVSQHGVRHPVSPPHVQNRHPDLSRVVLRRRGRSRHLLRLLERRRLHVRRRRRRWQRREEPLGLGGSGLGQAQGTAVCRATGAGQVVVVPRRALADMERGGHGPAAVGQTRRDGQSGENSLRDGRGKKGEVPHQPIQPARFGDDLTQ